MYFDYIKEREGFDSIVTDYGFLTYKVEGTECFIRDMYVKPEFRKEKKGSELIEKLTLIAKDERCDIITAREYPSVEQTNHSMLCALKNGFKIMFSNNEFIVIGKRV